MNFNSHAHVERDLDHRLQQAHEIHFNSHAHVERDGLLCGSVLCKIHFNSHAHVERDPSAADLRRAQAYFNSHAHVERDAKPNTAEVRQFISTHTLTWSVTLDVVYIWCLLNVMRTYCFI